MEYNQKETFINWKCDSESYNQVLDYTKYSKLIGSNIIISRILKKNFATNNDNNKKICNLYRS